MPTKRTRKTRGRTVLTLDSFDFMEIIEFLHGWQPARPEGTPIPGEPKRWADYRAFLADYLAIRDELLAAPEWMEHPTRKLIFGEWLLDTFGPDGPPETWGWVPSDYPAILPTHRVVLEFHEAEERAR